MPKLTLSDLASLTNQTSAIALINANNALTTTALENTLSRDGTATNTMSADIDLNSNDLLNVNSITATTAVIGGTNIAAQVAAAAASAAAAAVSNTAAGASATAAANAVSAVGAQYTFDSSTSMADPGTGDFRLNNGTVGSVTEIAFDATSADTGNPDLSDFIAASDDSTNTVAGHIIFKKSGTPATFAIFSITSVADNTGWLQATVVHVASGGTWTAADTAYVQFVRSGDVGATGSTGSTGSTGATGNAPGLLMAWESTTTDTDQGNGKVWLNNGTASSATVLYMDDLENGGASINTLVDSWDDSTTTALRGTITVTKNSSPQNFHIFNVTGVVTSASTYSKIAVTHVSSSGTISDGDAVSVQMVRTGNSGAGSGDMLAANNLSEVASVTTSRTNLGVGTGDSPQFTAVNVGAATDTTITRVSAGLIAVEGQNVTTVGGADVLVTDGGTGVSTLTDGGVLLGSGTGAITATAVLADGEVIVGDGTTDPVLESGATLRTSIGVAIGSDVQAFDADTLKADTADILTAGFAGTDFALGTNTTGTETLDYTNGNFQKGVNGGAHTLAPQTTTSSIVVQYTNNASAGTLTTSGYTIVTGDALTTTNGHDFMMYSTVTNSFKHLHVVALQ